MRTSGDSTRSLPTNGFRRLGPDIVEIEDAMFVPKMAYATPGNFTGKRLYPDGFDKIYIHQDCKKMLQKAGKKLKKYNVDHGTQLHFVVYDSLRPCGIQKKMFLLKPDANYVSNPGNCEDAAKVGQHNLGMAIDIGLANKSGKELGMGTKFDEFSPKSHIDNESELDPKSRGHRKILRDAMTAAGLKTYKNEWWHFNCPHEPGHKYRIQP